ncbi:MAG: glycoside hydrolase family 3 C-terminal domain-containing protein, partial [Lentisphaeria bacterium]|nr:glycoside hydrolase family 3 C-terminal domain-containing protein [Lentisphaeria bacterium]
MKKTILAIASIIAMTINAEEKLLDYKNMNLPVDQRVDDMLKRMTIEEKVSQIRSVSKAIPRLGIPSYIWWAECLHGVTAPGDKNLATCFPQALGMAASWNPDLLNQVGDAISDEARARHHHLKANGLTFFTPNINLVRDPRWGRTLETYGEDPFLTTRMGVSFITGLQGTDPKYYKIIATAKHYAAHSGPESKRRNFDAKVSMRDLWESYLPAFKAAVIEAKVGSVMTSYNAINGVPCTANHYLIEEVLREAWGFKGYVVSDDQSASDVYAYHRYAKSQKEGGAKVINNGCDIELGHAAFAPLATAVKEGLVTEERLTEACRRALTARFKLGMFDAPEKVPYAQIPVSVIGCKKNRDVARQMARESMVLLKNKANILPLDSNKLKKVAVIGPNANDPIVLTSNYFWSTPTAMITPYEGIKARLPNAEVTYTQGCNRRSIQNNVIIPSSALLPVTDQDNRQGLEAEYFNNTELEGQPVFTRIDQEVNFNWKGGRPHKKINKDHFSVRWTGRLEAPETGNYTITARCDDGVKVWLDGKLIINDWSTHGARDANSKPISLQAGKKYSIKMEYFEGAHGAVAQLKWTTPNKASSYLAAETAAKNADVAIVVLGLMSKERHPDNTEGEWGDRRGGGVGGSLTLNKVQEDLLKAVYATGKPTILVMINGGPLTSVWAQENVP